MPTATIKAATAKIVETISYEVIDATSLLMYSGKPVHKLGRLPPCHEYFQKYFIINKIYFLTLCIEVITLNKNNIILIGMPAVGKSTIGVILAKVLGYEFIDSDLVIQNKEKRLLREIIAAEGIEGFLSLENRINASIETTGAVISTGGSAVYGTEAMEHFQNIGTVIYLSVDFDVLSKRLVDIQNRGVAIRIGQSVEDLYKERVPLYKKYADITVDVSHAGISETIDMLKKALKL